MTESWVICQRTLALPLLSFREHARLAPSLLLWLVVDLFISLSWLRGLEKRPKLLRCLVKRQLTSLNDLHITST